MDLRAFTALTEDHTVIPLSRVVAADTLTPVAIYLSARRAGERGFLFESVEGGRHVARYSILGINARERITAADGQATARLAGTDGDAVAEGADVREVLKQRIATFRPHHPRDVPRFGGGYVGYVSFPCAAATEGVPAHPDPLGLPDAALYRFDDLIIFDHVTGQVVLIANAITDEHDTSEEAHADAAARLDRLEQIVHTTTAVPLPRHDGEPAVAPDETCKAFLRGVTTAKQHIVDGDIFQVVLSVQELIPFGGDPFDVYRHVRATNPSPYHFFLEQDDAVVLGASPEMLVRVEDRRMEVRPIAGTRPRGATTAEDDRLRTELLADAKEAAEHVMLVDLGRNDVGRVSRYGSVEVTTNRSVEKYSHVMHLVSSVSGHLTDDAHPIDALFAAFPAGTVSGAPKIRAMQIIHDLETTGRGVYSGAVGYFDYCGNTDTCIAIRSAVVKNGVAQVQAGAGIVADSDPESELAECHHKIAPIKAAFAAATPRTPDATA